MGHYPSDAYRLGAANRDPEEEALGWVVRLTSGEATEDDQREFAAWSEAGENAISFQRAVRLWGGLGPILEEQEAAGWPAAPAVPVAVPKRRFRPLARYAALAASIALVTMVGTQYLRVWRYDRVNVSTVPETASLADGSHIAMGPDTALDADFSGGARRVTLARGEAYFDVRHDAAHPFVITAGKGVIRVLGTAFTLRRRDDEVVVTVARGRVEVNSGDARAILTPDRQIHFDENGLGHMRAVDSSLAMAWMRGRLIMENRPLADVLAELDRYQDGRILLVNEKAGRRRINAVIDLGRIDSWLTALASSQGLQKTSIGPVTILR